MRRIFFWDLDSGNEIKNRKNKKVLDIQKRM